VLKDKKKKLIEKGHKKQFESTKVNPPNPWLESWDMDNLIKNIPK
jgi:hypothetical protein